MTALILALLALLVLSCITFPRVPLDAIRLFRDCRGGVEFNLISRDAQIALQEFSEEFTAALAQGAVTPWARDLGFYRASSALKTTFPIPISAAGYKELLGDVKYRKLFEKSLSMTPKTWQDGVEELASVIEAPDFIGWTSEPAAIAVAGQSLLNEIIVTLLEANPILDFDGKAMFAGDHPLNVLATGSGSFDNDNVGGVSIDSLKTAKESFRKIKGPNGKPLGLRMTHVLVPPAQEELWKDLLEQDMLIQTLDAGTTFGAVDNRHKGTVTLIVGDELTSDNYFYPLALNKPGLVPWIVQDQGAPEELRLDKTSDYYKRTLKVAIAYVQRGNGALALPHAIQRWDAS